MKERRDRKEMKADQQRYYEGMEELPDSRKAKERFRRPAYQARGMIREQGRQMERRDHGESKITEREEI